VFVYTFLPAAGTGCRYLKPVSLYPALGYRSRILTLNPNPITDPNPKINKKTKRHRNEIEQSYI